MITLKKTTLAVAIGLALGASQQVLAKDKEPEIGDWKRRKFLEKKIEMDGPLNLGKLFHRCAYYGIDVDIPEDLSKFWYDFCQNDVMGLTHNIVSDMSTDEFGEPQYNQKETERFLVRFHACINYEFEKYFKKWEHQIPVGVWEAVKLYQEDPSTPYHDENKFYVTFRFGYRVSSIIGTCYDDGYDEREEMRDKRIDEEMKDG